MSSETGISGMFSKFWKNIVDHFEDYEIKREEILHKLALVLIIVAGILLRLFPILKGYEMIVKAFDPHIQYASTEFILNKGFIEFIHWVKIDSWYPYGFNVGSQLYWGIPLSGVLIYWLLNSISINVTLLQAAFLSPLFYGTLTVISAYLLGKEAVNKRAGLFTAFFLSITPAYLSRSISGFYDNESIGILFVVLTMYLFIRSLKRDSAFSAFGAGLCLTGLMASWGAYRYMADLLPLALLFIILARKYSYRHAKTYTITISVSYTLGFVVTRVLNDNLFSIELIIPLLMIAFLIIISLLQNMVKGLSEKQIKQVLIVGVFSSLLIFTIVIVVLSVVGVFDNIAAKFLAVLIPGERSKIPIIASVSEHQPLAWSELFRSFYFMIFFFPLGIYYCLKKPTDVNILILTFGITALYFAGSMVRLVLLLAPIAALVCAIAVDKLLYTYSLSAHGKIALTKKKLRVVKSIGRDEAILAYLIVFGLMTAFAFHSVSTAEGYSSVEISIPSPFGNNVPMTDWQDALLWLRSNAQGEGITPNSPSVVLSWWDYGYWITNYGNATTLVDNATTNKTQIGLVGTMLMWNFEEAVKLMYKYNVKYVLINSQAGVSELGSDLGKSIWCIRIAESTVPQYGINETDFLGPNEQETRNIYYEPFYQSVLYRLAAYDSSTGFAFEQSWGPTSGRNPMFELAQNYPVLDLKGSDGFVYFKEAFRSYGLGNDASATYYKFPTVRIFEVIYPENIAQLSAELDYHYSNDESDS